MMDKIQKRIGTWLLVFSLIFAGIPFSLERVRASESNLAFSALASAKSSETQNPVQNINDGQASTRWAQDGEAPSSWVQLSWDTAQTMKSFRILWERRNAQSYQLEISEDGSTWKNISGKLSAPKSTVVEITLPGAKSAKYLRLNVTDISSHVASDAETMNWRAVSVWEMEVYSGDIPNPDESAEQIAVSLSEADAFDLSQIKEPELENNTKISMPSNLPDGAKADFCADFEQIVGRDGTVYTPLNDREVKGLYEIRFADGSSVKTEEYSIDIPGKYGTETGENEKPDVVPQLQEWYGKTGSFSPSAASRIVVGSSELKTTANLFAEDYQSLTGLSIRVTDGSLSDVRTGDFYLALSEEENGLGKEGYTIDIDRAAVVEAEEAVGAYWATRSLLQILKGTGGVLPKGWIRDYPKYEIRGFSLDVARKPFTLDAVKEIAKNMSWYKLNSFQVHLSDNLIFMEEYPSREKAIEKAYAGFRLESDVKNSKGESATSKDLFYTKEEFREFIKESRNIGVDVVPEIDFPAHALAFTRAFPEYMSEGYNMKHQSKFGDQYRPLIDEFDLSKDGAIDFAKSVWNDYFEGDDPIFDEETTVHVGTDEFHGGEENGNELFRTFADEMIRYVQANGRKVRMWASLSDKSGETPVASDGVQFNIWSKDYGRPEDMYRLGYDIINTADQWLYMVPNGTGSRGQYGDYLNVEGMYTSWKPNTMYENTNAAYTIPAGDDQMLGACFAIWHDNIDAYANGITQYDSFFRFMDTSAVFAEKLWNGDATAPYAEFSETAANMGTAPGTKISAETDAASNTIAGYTFEESLKKDFGPNGFDLTNQKNAKQVTGSTSESIALQLLGGESYVDTPLDLLPEGSVLTMKVKMNADAQGEQILCESKDAFGTYGAYALKASQKNTGKVGFSREGYDYSFDYTLPKGEWVTLTFESGRNKNGQNATRLYVGENREAVYESPEFYFANDETLEMKERIRLLQSRYRIAAVDTLQIPFGRIGSATNSFQGQIEEAVLTYRKETAGDTADFDMEAFRTETERYKAYEKDAYTDISWQKFADALSDANLILSWQGAAKEDGLFAKETLLAAAEELKEKPAEERLSDVINGAEQLMAEHYAKNGWAFYQAAVEEAKNVKSSASDAEKLAAAKKAEAAKAALAEIESLKAAIGEDLILSNYSSGSRAAYEAAVAAAEKIIQKESASRRETEEAKARVEEAKNSLVDLSDLEEALALANLKLRFASGDTAPLQLAANSAKTILEKDDATQREVSVSLAALHTAKERAGELSEEGKKQEIFYLEAIQTVKAAREEMMRADKYTEESLLLKKKAADKVTALLRDPDASSEEFSQALQTLKNAALVTKTDAKRTELFGQIEKAEATLKNAADYTEPSVEAFRSALQNAKAVLAKEDASLAELTNALLLLQGQTLVKKTTSDGAETKKITGIKFDAKKYQIAKGKKLDLNKQITVTPADAAEKNLIWKSSNPAYASVENGVVLTKKAGAGKKAVITAEAADGSGRKASVTVRIMKCAVTKVTLKAKKTIKAGKSMKIQAVIKTKPKGKSVNKKLLWISSNPKYATVTSQGKVKAKKAGKGKTVTIQAVSTDGTNKKGKVKIRIK